MASSHFKKILASLMIFLPSLNACMHASTAFTETNTANISPFSINRKLGENICATDNGGCEHICEERHGRFHRCKCRQGFKLASDKRRCHPIDPCAINRGGCEQHCVNDNGRAVCQCYHGLRIGPDQKSCVGLSNI
ncbi:unnamed protein product [Brugia timori]|uniref:EGF-like domain-containing protein n=1 Tax=Brugia timori TaxID=42155 RepID=A0A0R3R9Q3_9BILA|nr:unnamed protein product [Brugia timori]